MDQKTIRIFILSLFISILLSGNAFPLCYETAGGKLQSGSISTYIQSILRSYESDVPNGAVYTVQKKQGFYFKVCDEPGQVRHFMEKWAYPEVSHGDWQAFLTTKDKSKLNIIKEVGIYKIQRDGSHWSVWKYANMVSQKGKLFIKTDPQNARVRVLNIKPKFHQGMLLQPGRYHLEVSAKGYSTHKEWVVLRRNQDVTIKVVLNPGSAIQIAQNSKSGPSKNASGEYQFAFKDAIVTVHGYKWIDSIQVQSSGPALKEIKTINGVIHPKDGFKLISLQCSFKPKTSRDVRFNNILLNLYVNDQKSNLVCWYLPFGSPSDPMRIAMSSISKQACQDLKPVVVFIVPHSVSAINISVGMNADDSQAIVNLRNLEEEKI